MNLSQQIKDYAETVGCRQEISALDRIIDILQNSRTLNIAILGETNCGKTYLMNRLAGREVRKPSMLSADGTPLMVTFQEGEGRPGYEIIVLDAPEPAYERLSFFEIPINLAIDYETRELSPMLEEMDAVIYILSAVTPMTASDAANIRAVADRLPMLFYTSKADLLGDGLERETCSEYLRQQLSVLTEGAELLDGSWADAAECILKKLNCLSAEELREFHAARLRQKEKDVICLRLNRQIKDLDAERKRCESQKAAADADYRARLLVWSDLRVQLLERESDLMSIADKETKECETVARDALLQQIKTDSREKEWSVSSLEAAVERELENAAQSILPQIEDRAEADAAWLVSEVNRRLEVRIAAEDGAIIWRQESPALNASERMVQKPDRGKLIAAAGSGILAGGAILSSMALAPTCMVAIPASIAAFHFLHKDADERQAYHEELERLVTRICEGSFTQLSETLCRNIKHLYEGLLETIQRKAGEEKPDSDLHEIRRRKAELLHMLEELETKPAGLE